MHKTGKIFLGLAIAFIVLSFLGFSCQLFYENLEFQRKYENLLQNYTVIQEKYVNLQNEYSKLKKDYILLENSYEELQTAYNDLNKKYFKLKNDYATLFQSYKNLKQNIKTLYRNPTYHEVKQFIMEDQTDKNEYIENEYTCFNFAADINNNAENQGIRCGFVVIDLGCGEGHALVCFETTDKGLIFIEPQNDREVKVEVGLRYWKDNFPGEYIVDFDDTITKIIIIW